MKTTLVVLEPDQPCQTTFIKSTNNSIVDQSIQEITSTLDNTCITETMIELVPKPEKHYSSASLTFHSKQKGFMMCNEYRYKERKVLIHPIGGKTESFDDSVLITAIREFIEETDLINHEHINSAQLDKNGLIEHINNLIGPYCTQTHAHFDVCVNDAKKYYHKYYVLSIEDIEKDKNPNLNDFLSHILELDKFFNGKSHTEIQSICWKKLKNLRFNNKSSWMTTRFVKLISKKKLF